MKYDSLMIHYGELTTKGNNRRSFIDMLTHNVRVALKAFPNVEVKSSRDHLYVLRLVLQNSDCHHLFR